MIFGSDSDNEVIGVTTLEQLGFHVDPVNKKIEPMPMYLLSAL